MLRDPWQVSLVMLTLTAVTSNFQGKITASLSVLSGAVQLPQFRITSKKMWLFTAKPETKKERMDDACPAAQPHRKLERPGAKNA